MYIGSYEIDDVLTFYARTYDLDTPADADAVPAYRVYEDETGTPILTGNMALIDSSNTDGKYSEQITLSAANGFEFGKSYSIDITATVGSQGGACERWFQVGAKVAVYRWQGTLTPSPATAGYPVITIKDGTGTGEIDTSSGKVPATIAAGDMATDSVTAAALTTDAATKIFNSLVAGHTTVGGVGKLIADNLDATVSSRASSTEVTSIQNNTRVVRVVPSVIERPDSGTTEYRIELLLYDTVGNMEVPDSAPTIALVDQGGTDLSGRLDSATMALVSTGRYRAIYTATNTDDLEQLVWAFSVVEGGNTRIYGNTTIIVDTTAVDFTSSDRSNLALILGDTNELQTDWADGGRLDLLLDFIKDVEEGDHYVDKTTDPLQWQLVITRKGTGGPGVGVELLRKDIKDVDGVALVATTTVRGQFVEP